MCRKIDTSHFALLIIALLIILYISSYRVAHRINLFMISRFSSYQPFHDIAFLIVPRIELLFIISRFSSYQPSHHIGFLIVSTFSSYRTFHRIDIFAELLNRSLQFQLKLCWRVKSLIMLTCQTVLSPVYILTNQSECKK